MSIRAFAVLCAAGIVAPVATAEIIEFSYSATIISREGDWDGPWGGAELGDEMIFSYVIDTETPDQVSSPSFGVYELLGISLEIDGIRRGATGLEPLRVTIPEAFDTVDTGGIGFWDDVAFDNAALDLGGIGALASDVIPIDFDLGAFSSRWLQYGVESSEGETLFLTATIHDYTMTVIPAPGILAFIALAMAAAFPRGRLRLSAGSRDRRPSSQCNAYITHTHTHTLARVTQRRFDRCLDRTDLKPCAG